MLVRSAKRTDTVKIAATHRASISDLCSEFYTKQEIDGWIGIIDPSIYENAIKEKVMIVAEEDDEILGLGILDLEHSEIGALYVHPNAKGEGIGNCLLADSNCKCTTHNLTEDFMGCPVAQALTWPVIETMHCCLNLLPSYCAEVAPFREILPQ